MFLKSGAEVVSPWHDVPLYADASGKVLNFICEIPKETKAKVRCGRAQRGHGTVRTDMPRRRGDVPLTPCRQMEVATDESRTPIKQDTKKGKLRDYPCAP